MSVNQGKINVFADVYIRRSFKIASVGAKKLNKAEFYFLVEQILSRTDNIDSEEIVYRLTK